MQIQKATREDVPKIEELLYQVHKVHSDKRPDIFIPGLKKYSKEQILELIDSPSTPIYVYKENGEILGYAFVIYMIPKDKPSLVQIKTMYIDDLCVDKNVKGNGIGTIIFKDLEKIAKQESCYNIILNVYNFNESAMKFYEKCGMSRLSTHMEKII